MRTFNRILFQLGISTTLLCTLPLAMTQTKRTGPSVTSVTVTPNPVVLYVGQSLQLGLTITGTGSYTKQVTWSTTGGLVSSMGYYTAPATPGAFNVTAKSVAAGNPSSTILVQVKAIPAPCGTITINEVTTSPDVWAPVTYTSNPPTASWDWDWSVTDASSTVPGDPKITSIVGPVLGIIGGSTSPLGTHVEKLWAVNKTNSSNYGFGWVNIVAPAYTPVTYIYLTDMTTKPGVPATVAISSITPTTAQATDLLWSSTPATALTPGTVGGDTTNGLISATGVYTPPTNPLLGAKVYRLWAVSKSDATVKDFCYITITAAQ